MAPAARPCCAQQPHDRGRIRLTRLRQHYLGQGRSRQHLLAQGIQNIAVIDGQQPLHKRFRQLAKLERQLAQQQPALPFAARWHVRHRLDEGLTGALEWSGNAWVDAWAIGQADVAQSSGFVELRVPLTELGDPETVELHLTMINEKGLAEWTWGAVPSGSLVDNYDPDYGGYFEFELQGSTVPADHVELP